MKDVTGTPSFIRTMNRANVLDLIRRNGSLSQAEIAKKLSLQPSTILRIVNELVDEQLIVEIGKTEVGAKGGRRASLLGLNGKGPYAIGIDLASDEMIGVLVNLTGDVICEVRRPFSPESGAAIILDEVKMVVSQLLTSPSIQSEKVLGIGVSMPGKVNSSEGISVYAIGFKNWRNVPLVKELESYFQIPVYLEHDIRSMAFGEIWFGKECTNMICLGFRRGIGLATIINGELYRGSHEFAGDVGHVVVDPNGPLCRCGRRGCLEAIASEKAIISQYREYANQNNLKLESLTMQTIYKEMKKGTPVVMELVKGAANHMGRVLVDLVRIFDPERIIIGGNSIATSLEFQQYIRSFFQENQPNYADPNMTIESTHFGDNCSAVGAAAIILSSLFKPISGT